jgi:hypothetical protein
MHASHRDAFLAGHTIVQGDHTAAVHTPRDFVFVLASGNATVALDTTLCVTNKFHACHVGSPD